MPFKTLEIQPQSPAFSSIHSGLKHFLQTVGLLEINQEERAANLEFGVILQVVGDKLDWEDLYDEKKLREFLGQSIVSFGLEVIEQHSTYRLLLRRSLE